MSSKASPQRAVCLDAHTTGRHRPPGWAWAFAASFGALVWCYWPVLASLHLDWMTDENYSVGQLVPFAAVFVLWHKRSALSAMKPRICWAGAGVICLSLLMRLAGLVYLYESAERYAMLLSLYGVVLLCMGWKATWSLRYILTFLLLMIPLPGRVHNLISGPLQNQATAGAVFCLELLGVTVTQSGNTIVLNHATELAVAEACSGLRMLTAFVVVSAVLAMIIQRPSWQKFVLLASSIPVAIVCNLIRLLVTAYLYMTLDSAVAEKFFHDFAGLVMMPLAIGMLLGELWLMQALTIAEQPDKTQEPAGKGKATGARRPG